MLSDEQFNDYMALCEQIANRMHSEGFWPWTEQNQSPSDSTLGENLLDSDHCQ